MDSLLFDDIQSLSGTGVRTGFAGERLWNKLLAPVEDVLGGIAFGEGKESRLVAGSTFAIMFAIRYEVIRAISQV